MENKHKITITDTSKIKKIEFKYPFMVNEDAERIIKEKHQYLKNKETQLKKAKQEVINIEQEVLSLKEEFKNITKDCKIEYETYDKEYITRKSSLFIAGQGNDTLGRFGN